jgi:hypothetical protein
MIVERRRNPMGLGRRWSRRRMVWTVLESYRSAVHRDFLATDAGPRSPDHAQTFARCQLNLSWGTGRGLPYHGRSASLPIHLLGDFYVNTCLTWRDVRVFVCSSTHSDLARCRQLHLGSVPFDRRSHDWTASAHRSGLLAPVISRGSTPLYWLWVA